MAGLLLSRPPWCSPQKGGVNPAGVAADSPASGRRHRRAFRLRFRHITAGLARTAQIGIEFLTFRAILAGPKRGQTHHHRVVRPEGGQMSRHDTAIGGKRPHCHGSARPDGRTVLADARVTARSAADHQPRHRSWSFRRAGRSRTDRPPMLPRVKPGKSGRSGPDRGRAAGLLRLRRA